ncbi:hypothetical protein [Neorhizobium galegae]|uniref:Restriction endonuclease n=1 Tax=Neorhizobium galegae bv. orientalis str. HAMBI 540 TaxID=1028800 RepID=A0A068SVQ7_NEOGA|nr:hypothetical protein [Neorhizobium galegae]CDN49190.1 Hypothetical protein RG540_CH30250 [Neorhizobium galegae bv. orientalis str. HAMBI 540]
MSRHRFKLYLNRYNHALSLADDGAFLRLIWAVNAIQSGMERRARGIIEYPREAITQSIPDQYTIHKWELETIIMSLLTISKDRPRKGRFRYLNCNQYRTLRQIAHILRQVENEEYGLAGSSEDVFDEMHRIAQRQFGWQRGLFNVEVLYRYVFVYGQGKCAEYFKERYGISVSTFLKVSIAATLVIGERPWQNKPTVGDVGITPEQLDKALAILSIDLDEARTKAGQMVAQVRQNGRFRIAYQPNLLRQHPIITTKNVMIAPLWQLIIYRATVGLFHDIQTGGQALITEAGHNFEVYVRSLIKGYLPSFEPGGEEKYTYKKNPIDTPDILLRKGGKIVAVFECKATKLTYAAQFAENPFDEAADKYKQLVKGIFQIWRFFSHARRGIFKGDPVSPEAMGVLLTLDSWMQMSSGLRDRALAEAKTLTELDPEITDEDRRPIAFAAASELDSILRVSTDNELLQAFTDAASDNYRGWAIFEVRRDAGGPLSESKLFPLDFSALLPWFDDISKMASVEE